MVRVKNTTGGTKVIFGIAYLGGQTIESDDFINYIFINNRFEVFDSEETEPAVVEETVVEEVNDSEVQDLSSMTKREIQVWLKEQGIPYKLSDNKAALLGLSVLEEE